jgi:hypothetical protein
MSDLTRWNRAGLRRFRYVDGNAITHLEALRAALARAYGLDRAGNPRWPDLVQRHPVLPGETAAARLKRLDAQYHDPRRDHGWEILRAFARSTHVLTEHTDAFANETFIGTATQWESVRRLIAMLDARPKPGASARTQVAIEAKAAGTLARGFQVKTSAKDGRPPVVFETTEDLAVDPALNALRPCDWDKSAVTLDVATTATFPLAEGDAPPVVGEIGVLVIAKDGVEAGHGVAIAKVEGSVVTLSGSLPAASEAPPLWQVALLVGAARVQSPRLAGPKVVELTPGHNLVAGRSTVAWDDGGWKIALVEAVDGNRVRLKAAVPAKDERVYLLAAARAQAVGADKRVVLPAGLGAGSGLWRADQSGYSGKIEEQLVVDGTGKEVPGQVLYKYVTGVESVYFLPAGSEAVATVSQSPVTGLTLAGDVDDVRPGDWIALAGSPPKALRVTKVTKTADDTAFETSPVIADPGVPVHAAFARRLRPLDHARNRLPPFDPASRSDQVTRLLLGPEAAALMPGRRVIVTDGAVAHPATVRAVGPGTADIAPPLPGSELTDPQPVAMERWNTTVLANVAPADHGETQPLKILGSGDATRSGQLFELTAQELSFLADPSMPTGVRAALELTVDGRIWTQVANLADSGPEDAHYQAEATETGAVLLRFGDGLHGRRLPTGTNNVRAVWRKGLGEQGNLEPGALVKLGKPDPLVASVRHPVPATGGAERESVASMRANSAAGLLTLDRAVSAADFAALAAQNASVWQAAAWKLRSGGARGERVMVVVVPAGGVMGGLKPELEAFLLARTVPGATPLVEAYQALPLCLDVEVAVRSAEFLPDQVRASVEAAIRAAWDIRTARLGAALYRTQVVALIEGVTGVENVVVRILPATWANADPQPQIGSTPTSGVALVRPAPHQMIHVAAASQIAVRTVEYRS